jgi:hypothetical protein
VEATVRLPGWIVPDGRGDVSEDGLYVTYTFRVRRWHPGFWLAVVRSLWRYRR